MCCVYVFICDIVLFWLWLVWLESYGFWCCYCLVFLVVFCRVYLVCDLKDDFWFGCILSIFLKYCLLIFEWIAWYMLIMLVYWYWFYLVFCLCLVGINGIDDNRMCCIFFIMKGLKVMIILIKKKFVVKWILIFRKVWLSF